MVVLFGGVLRLKGFVFFGVVVLIVRWLWVKGGGNALGGCGEVYDLCDGFCRDF